MKKIILCIATLSLLAACSSSPIKSDDQSTSAQSSSAAKAGPTSGATTTPVSAGSATTQAGSAQINRLKDRNSILAKRSVFFAFDQYTIDDQYRSMIQAHAAYLHTHPSAKVTLEGNADERGGAEYNLALGQKRAEAERKMKALLGVSEQQMEAISFGKEKPKALGSDEAAWAQNRRTDLHYKSE